MQVFESINGLKKEKTYEILIILVQQLRERGIQPLLLLSKKMENGKCN